MSENHESIYQAIKMLLDYLVDNVANEELMQEDNIVTRNKASKRPPLDDTATSIERDIALHSDGESNVSDGFPNSSNESRSLNFSRRVREPAK